MLHIIYFNKLYQSKNARLLFYVFTFFLTLFLPFQLAVQAQPNEKLQNGVDTIVNGPLPQVNELDWSIADPSSVSDSDAYIPIGYSPDQSLAYYLGHFHRLANAVRDSDPNRGFIDIHVWREASHQVPDNARIMESTLSLAWMYTKDEPWNPYYGDEATRLRMEAAIKYWLNFQDDLGFIGERDLQRNDTFYFIKYMGQTLSLLHIGPSIDSKILDKMSESLRKAIIFVLNDDDYIAHAQQLSNQFTNLIAGSMAYLTLYEDTQVAKELKRKMLNNADYQSETGYLPQGPYGPDWGYYFGTHNINFHMMWHYGYDMAIDGIDLGEIIIDIYNKATDWLAYNAVPDRELFYLNSAIETRQTRNHFNRLETPLSKEVPLVRAFNVTREEFENRLSWSRSKLANEWSSPPALQNTFNGYTPSDFLLREFENWYPTQAQRKEAHEHLPYIANDRFNHQRVDDRTKSTFTYIRRPNYYAVFNSGPILNNKQRLGLGLIWHPKAGLVFQSSSGDDGNAWGTRLLSDKLLVESGSIYPTLFEIEGGVIQPESGVHDLADGELKVTYGGNLSRYINKILRFEEERIQISVSMTGREQEIAEQIPLMLDEKDNLAVEGNHVVLTRDEEVIMVISFKGVERILTSQAQREGHLRRVWVMGISSNGSLEYTLNFDGKPLSTSTIEQPEALPRKAELLQNYPNPFNPSTTIPFTLTQKSQVQIDVYDSLGRQVKSLTNQPYEAGHHKLQWNSSGLASGLYIVRMVIGNLSTGSETIQFERKITLVK
jgi:hypothetical protein